MSINRLKPAYVVNEFMSDSDDNGSFSDADISSEIQTDPNRLLNQLSAYDKPLCHHFLSHPLRMTLISVINFTIILRMTKFFCRYNEYGTG